MNRLEVSVLDRPAIETFKIVALANGLRIDPRVLDRLGGPGRLTIHEYTTTGGITLELAGDVLVNAPFDEPFCAESPLRLTVREGSLRLELGSASVEVERVLPLPGYLDMVDAHGNAVADTTMSHADRIRVSPINGCAYNCGFCDMAATRYRPRAAAQVLAGIDVALTDDQLPARHLLISGGSPARGMTHQDDFEHVCRAIVRHVRRATEGYADPFEVDIMMSARPDGDAFVERMVAEGVTGFSLNVEVFSDQHAQDVLPLKYRFTREHLEPMIRRAVELLGGSSGRVRSLIIPGLEPVDRTLEGIEWLATLGCSPVISPFRPARGTRLSAASPPAPETLRTVLDEARSIVRRHGVALGPRCVACQHNTLAFPWDVAPQRDPRSRIASASSNEIPSGARAPNDSGERRERQEGTTTQTRRP